MLLCAVMFLFFSQYHCSDNFDCLLLYYHCNYLPKNFDCHLRDTPHYPDPCIGQSLGQNIEFREAFDVAVGRAVAETRIAYTNIFYVLCVRLCLFVPKYFLFPKDKKTFSALLN